MGRESRFDDFIRAFSALKTTGDRENDLGLLLDETLRLGAGDKGHALLMKKNTVVAEASRARDGGSFQVDEDARKAAARLGIAAQNGDAPPFERNGERLTIPFTFSEKEAAAITLFGISEHDDGEYGLAFAWAATRLLAMVEENRVARARVAEAEGALNRGGGVGGVAYLKPVSELERDAIELALRTTNWNKEDAARRLGISRASIYMKVKKYGLQHPPRESDAE